MGVHKELEFEKYCIVERSPTTVLPSPRHCSKVEKRNSKVKAKCGNDLWSLNEDFAEINFCNCRSASCRSFSSIATGLEGNELRRTGSVYKSSTKLHKMKKTGGDEARRIIKFSSSTATDLSLGIVDSLCSSDEDSSLAKKISSMMLQNLDFSPHKEPSFQNFVDHSPHTVSDKGVSSNGLLEITLDSDNGENQSPENAERRLIDADAHQDRSPALTLHKSLSARLALPHSLARSSESGSSKTISPKSRFGPIRKMFDPFVKSKSQRSPLGSAIEASEVTPTAIDGLSKNKTFRKSLLHDFSNIAGNTECSSRFISIDQKNSIVPCSPAQLHGLLKFENDHGVPYLKFTVKSPAEVFVAKTWKAENSLNWVYTFYSVRSKRKSTASGWGLKENNKESPMVGQMQVSYYLCTELKDARAFDNSMVTEFVLYGTKHARESVAQGTNNCSPHLAKPFKVSGKNSLGETCQLDEVPNQAKLKGQPKHASYRGHLDSSTPHHFAAAELHPNLEIAAIVIQAPFEKRESLKCQGGDQKADQQLPNLFDEQRKKGIPDYLAKVNVVIPSGSHSLPNCDGRGPSPLLDRWRLGGGCDCGGWDMACPLTVLGNPNIHSAESHPRTENQPPLVLYVQGIKENTPALTITVFEDGQYAVDFHAQLSTLQAFSICVALLHTMEASIAARQEIDKNSMQCDSLRVFIEDEVNYLIEAVTEEEKTKVNKKMEQVLPSFVLDPPFSPIARV